MYYYKIEQAHPCEASVLVTGRAGEFPLVEGRAELMRVTLSAEEEFASGFTETLMGVG